MYIKKVNVSSFFLSTCQKTESFSREEGSGILLIFYFTLLCNFLIYKCFAVVFSFASLFADQVYRELTHCGSRFFVLFLFLPWFQIVVRVASKILQFLSPQHQRYCVFSMSVMCSAFVLGLQNTF